MEERALKAVREQERERERETEEEERTRRPPTLPKVHSAKARLVYVLQKATQSKQLGAPLKQLQ